MFAGNRLAAEHDARVPDWNRCAPVSSSQDRHPEMPALPAPGCLRLLTPAMGPGSRRTALGLTAVVRANTRFSDHAFSK